MQEAQNKSRQKTIWLSLLTIIVVVFVFNRDVIATYALPPINPYNDCPPNSTANNMIWVLIEAQYSPTGEEVYRQIPFDTGTIVYEEVINGVTELVEYDNYVRGVLIGELGNAEPLVNGNRWHFEMLKAMAVAIRTKAFDRCGTFERDGVYGIRGNTVQEYRYDRIDYGVSEKTHQDFQKAIDSTKGIYLAYGNGTFDIIYRNWTGLRTVDNDLPHKSIYDPVGLPFEPESKSGLPQINANYWALGDSQGVHFPQLNYLQILTHYYTGVQVVDINGNIIQTPDYRWTSLDVDWGNGSITPTTVMTPSQSYTTTFYIQNSGVITFEDTIKLAYYWLRNGEVVGTPSLEDVDNLGLGVGDDTGGKLTFQVDVPSSFNVGDTATLMFDLRNIDDPLEEYFRNREADNGKVWFGLSYNFCIGGVCNLYLPTVLKNYPLPQDTYEPNDSLNEAYPITDGITYTFYIWESNDVDWFQFNVSVPANKERLVEAILKSIPAGTDYDLAIYDANGNELDKSVNGSNSDEYVSVVATSTDTYYLEVYSYQGTSQSDSYELRVEIGPPLVPKK